MLNHACIHFLTLFMLPLVMQKLSKCNQLWIISHMTFRFHASRKSSSDKDSQNVEIHFILIFF